MLSLNIFRQRGRIRRLTGCLRLFEYSDGRSAKPGANAPHAVARAGTAGAVADFRLLAGRIEKMHPRFRGANISGISMNTPDRAASLLDQTLAAASRDKQTVTPESKMIGPLVEGVRIREAPTHTDERGSVVEIYDLRWKWHQAPLVSAHCFTVRPGFVKGWGLHKTHEDRYFILQGY
ncbi:MAG TPA: hypothetical protein VGN55_26160, partial [Xanthobacteraceae bacterium]